MSTVTSTAASAARSASRLNLFAATSTPSGSQAVRGGAVALVSHAARFALRTGSMMLMARLLSPADFGLQGMVVAITGFLSLFKDAGLSAVTIQRDDVTHEQVSTLFWVNAAVGVALGIAMLALAPLIASFYGEEQLTAVALWSAPALVFNGLAVQHYALLQRQMRFVALGVIEIASIAIANGVGLTMALLGYGYWALVAVTVMMPFVMLAGCLIALPWAPGLPKRNIGMRSMLSFGGILTLNSLVVYVAYNTEKVLLGRFWGAEALGLYGRAYQLISLPSDLIIYAVSTVAFPSLARLQSDGPRLERAFLKGYSFVLSLTIPTTLCCAVFAEEIVRIVLGPKWAGAVPIFRLITPTIVGFALINPFAWFLISSGRTKRSLGIAFLIAPTIILGAVLGLGYGPIGVALAFSSMISILTVPVIAWARAGTTMSAASIWSAIRGPLIAGPLAAGAGYALKLVIHDRVPALPIAVAGGVVVYATYFAILLFPLGQRDAYAALWHQVVKSQR